MENLKKLKRDLRRSKFGLDEMTIFGAIFVFIISVVAKITIGFEIIQYVIYGLTLVILLSHVLKYRGKLDGNAIGLLSWIEKYFWRAKDLSIKISYVLQILSVIFVLSLSSILAFKYLDYNWLFCVIIGIVFFSITGVGIFWLFIMLYKFIVNRIWNSLNRFYYARLCQSVSKVENNIKKTLVSPDESKNVNERRITVLQAWKAIQKLGTLQEILNFWLAHKEKIGKGNYLSQKVMTVLSNKMIKEDLSYQLYVFPTLLDWFIEFKNLSISTLRISSDTFVKSNQDFFDLLVINLPTYNGRIYFALEMQEIKMLDIITSLYSNFTAYLRDSDAVRSGDIREQFKIDKEKQSDLFHRNHRRIALKQNVFNKTELDTLGDSLAKRLADPDNMIIPSDIQKVVYQQEIFLAQEGFFSEFVEKIKSGNISICNGEYNNGYSVVRDYATLSKYLSDFLENINHENELGKRVTAVETKNKVIFNADEIKAYLMFLFYYLVNSTDDVIIKKIVRLLHESLIYLTSYCSSKLNEFVSAIIVSWLDGKHPEEALMIEAIVSIEVKHKEVVSYIIKRKLKS